jgi:hypothetical protein
VFGYYGENNLKDIYNELNGFGCKVIYNVKLGEIATLQKAKYYYFKVDFENRMELYTQNNY